MLVTVLSALVVRRAEHVRYEDLGSVLLCQAFRHDIMPPDFNWMVASGWWNANYMPLLAECFTCIYVTQAQVAGFTLPHPLSSPQFSFELSKPSIRVGALASFRNP